MTFTLQPINNHLTGRYISTSVDNLFIYLLSVGKQTAFIVQTSIQLFLHQPIKFFMIKMQQIKTSNKYFRLLFNIQRYVQGFTPYSNFTTTIDAIDLFSSNELPFQRHRGRERNQLINVYSMRYFMENESNRRLNIEKLTPEEIDDLLQDLLIKNKYAQITNIINDCLKSSKLVSDNTIKKLFRIYSLNGRTDAVEILQKYCSKLNPCLNKRNGEFMHYMAKAHCMKGNSDNGLLILKQAYVKYEGLRSFYRVIFRELIYDSVQNRSEASLVTFTKYVLIFSEVWNDHYPLICFWHTCWSSSWFSDQMLSNNLLENSEALRQIVKDKATTFCINILKEYNEDAVVRLLQTLLKYEMMVEYSKVLNILFTYKLKNRDLRGCTEILKNCETLGISLSSHQQGRYIKMLINSKYIDKTPDDKPQSSSTNFKLKF